MSNLVYRKPGNAYTSAVVCTLEGEQIVIRDGSGVTRMDKTGSVILRIAEICCEADLELGPVGLELKNRWLERQKRITAQIMDLPDFEAEYVGKRVGRELHVELARAGHGQGYKFCSDLLEHPVTSLALLTLEEACAVRDALTADEDAYFETCHVPEVTLTNPVFPRGFRISLDPNQSGVSARARRGLGL